MELFRDGKNLEAVQSLQSAVQADPQFALAYSRLAEADSALGYMAEAESNSRKAQELSDSLPPAEKYLVQAIYARTVKNNKKAIEAYENLAKIMPDNSDVESALGSLYSESGDYDKARAQFAKILRSDPKNMQALWQMGVVEITNSRQPVGDGHVAEFAGQTRCGDEQLHTSAPALAGHRHEKGVRFCPAEPRRAA